MKTLFTLVVLVGLSVQAFAAPPDADKAKARKPESKRDRPFPGVLNVVQGIGLVTPGVPALNQSLAFTVNGQGQCRRLRVDWGDNSAPSEATSVDLGVGARFTHTFSGWNGLKTVTAEGVDGCSGKVRTTVPIPPTRYRLAYAAGPRVCDPIPNRPAVPRNARVRVQTEPSPRINFGCPLGTCVHDADGKAGPAGTGFPFPALRPFSLVLRVGSQVAQGGTFTSFVTTQAGPLEVCVNDGVLTDNAGGWEIHFVVEMLGAP
jgi:hypothetical protein